ncbi:DUF3892 domain-containing protein [Alicyclobacillus sp. ALC3]|uniref:DUF3892 domain-containing protein n=1 Tax=Alicyclobacillus sp. ALC3 TaxID=2796143 RepID=UPI002379452B|nr:DUF3892 domain-containing protein [Alicyclobacillus sp. ALC3]WDL95842.1 DUF3892 domain-containing protein [Alicyclobacillus sp. ALC3]
MTGHSQVYTAGEQVANGREGGTAAERIAHRNRVVGVRKNADGDIVQFRFADGRVVDYRGAIKMARNGQGDEATVSTGDDGAYPLRSDADANSTNIFDNPPPF